MWKWFLEQYSTVTLIEQLSFQKFPNTPTIFIVLKHWKMSLTKPVFKVHRQKHGVCMLVWYPNFVTIRVVSFIREYYENEAGIQWHAAKEQNFREWKNWQILHRFVDRRLPRLIQWAAAWSVGHRVWISQMLGRLVRLSDILILCWLCMVERGSLAYWQITP